MCPEMSAHVSDRFATDPGCAHQQPRLIGLDALLQRLLDVNRATDPVLSCPQWQLHLQVGAVTPLCRAQATQCMTSRNRMPSESGRKQQHGKMTWHIRIVIASRRRHFCNEKLLLSKVVSLCLPCSTLQRMAPCHVITLADLPVHRRIGVQSPPGVSWPRRLAAVPHSGIAEAHQGPSS